MPGANCGGCGFAGCSAYAAAVAEGTAKPGLCSPGGKALAEKMGEIMGVAVEDSERKVAFVFCQGGKDVTKVSFDIVCPTKYKSGNYVQISLYIILLLISILV